MNSLDRILNRTQLSDSDVQDIMQLIISTEHISALALLPAKAIRLTDSLNAFYKDIDESNALKHPFADIPLSFFSKLFALNNLSIKMIAGAKDNESLFFDSLLKRNLAHISAALMFKDRHIESRSRSGWNASFNYNLSANVHSRISKDWVVYDPYLRRKKRFDPDFVWENRADTFSTYVKIYNLQYDAYMLTQFSALSSKMLSYAENTLKKATKYAADMQRIYQRPFWNFKQIEVESLLISPGVGSDHMASMAFCNIAEQYFILSKKVRRIIPLVMDHKQYMAVHNGADPYLDIPEEKKHDLEGYCQELLRSAFRNYREYILSVDVLRSKYPYIPSTFESHYEKALDRINYLSRTRDTDMVLLTCNRQ